MEVHAIERCAQFNIDRGYHNKNILILSYSQAALKALSSPSVKSKLVWNCIEKFNLLSRRNKVSLLWVPGHIGMIGNEKADNLAKVGSSSPLMVPEPFCGLSTNSVGELVKGWLNKQNDH